MRREDHDDGGGERRTRGLMALALVLLLGLVASYLVRELRKEGAIEDCLLAGRTNCDALLDDR
jgi:hypothetical protein